MLPTPPAKKTLADYVAIALSPVLIMALVGSLVFFLVEVLYVGHYQDSLLFILFFFVFAAVLIARISMRQDIANRAGLYGAALGLVTWLGLLVYVDYPPDAAVADWAWAINLGLMVLIWWSAHRLTWDCTLIDDQQDASGAGLLEQPADEDAAEEKAPPPRPATGEPALVSWWERYLHFRAEQRKRPHTPGVWVVYFSLAALPLFAVGQSLIPPNDVYRRRGAFWLVSVYVASGLGLLLTTSFLGLRRYLRQRKLKMPAAMTGAWIIMGGVLILVFLLVGALLPRPAGDRPLVDFSWFVGHKERKASRWAVRDANPGKDEGSSSSTAEPDPEGDTAGQTDQDKGKGGAGKGEGQGSGEASDKGGASNQQGNQAGSQAGKNQTNPSGQPGNQSGPKPPPQSSQNSGPQQAPDQGGKPPPDDDRRGGAEKRDARQAPNNAGQRRASREAPNASSPLLESPAASQAAVILKWVVLGIIALVVLFFVVRFLLSFLANFTDWAARLFDFLSAFWRGLMPEWGRRRTEAAEAEAVRPVPFRAFRDPFETGRAGRMPVGQLVRYSFEALEAWSREQGLPRPAGETPLEFVGRLCAEVPPLETGVRRLADYYVGLAYARREPPEECRETLRRLWQALRSAAVAVS
jgi:hypothetical protein